MHLACGNAYFRPHAKLATISELGRSISHQDCTINTLKETLCNGIVFRHDAICVVGAIFGDMRNCPINPINKFCSNNHIQILLPPITRACRCNT